MKAKNLGILSALTASVCCLGPLLLILLGLGGLGLGAMIGKNHWYFIIGAGALLAFAWRSFLKEKKSCETRQCEMENKNMTRNILMGATLIVMTFVGLNVYTYARGGPSETATKSGVQMTIPVEGMTCFTCEMTVQSAVKKLPGVSHAAASAKHGNLAVSYDPAKVSLDEIVKAVNATGYKAKRP